MTAYELFCKIYEAMKSQGWHKSMDDDDCRLRGPDGLKCAIEHIIPDDKYSSSMERIPIMNLDNDYAPGIMELIKALDWDNLSLNSKALLIACQAAHDRSPAKPSVMKNRFDNLGRLWFGEALGKAPGSPWSK